MNRQTDQLFALKSTRGDSSTGRERAMPMALKPKSRDPFLLPLCDCGGPMNLASLEPHPMLAAHELKTFKCQLCGAEQVYDVEKRAAERG